MSKRSAHYEPYLRMIEEINERNRMFSRGGPYIHVDPYNTTSHPETIIGLQPGLELSYDHLGKRHTFFVRPDGGPAEHTEMDVNRPCRRPRRGFSTLHT